jgi:hypothetical protein
MTLIATPCSLTDLAAAAQSQARNEEAAFLITVELERLVGAGSEWAPDLLVREIHPNLDAYCVAYEVAPAVLQNNNPAEITLKVTPDLLETFAQMHEEGLVGTGSDGERELLATIAEVVNSWTPAASS